MVRSEVSKFSIRNSDFLGGGDILGEVTFEVTKKFQNSPSPPPPTNELQPPRLVTERNLKQMKQNN